jgi:hypothetical protein
MLPPRLPIRRFDVFAEYNRQEALAKGVPEDEAAGYGLWVAKVVASGGGRGRSPFSPAAPRERDSAGRTPPPEEAAPARGEKWHVLGGEPQTDTLFEREIVARMGQEFYETVFAPAIAEAIRQRKSYQAIRDTIRRDWTPAPPARR